jgi:hypothetical protein
MGAVCLHFRSARVHPRFLVLFVLLNLVYVCFADRCLSFCPFSFGHCVVCSSSIYGFWLPLWYLQTLLISFGRQWRQVARCMASFLDKINYILLFLWESDLWSSGTFIPTWFIVCNLVLVINTAEMLAYRPVDVKQ